MNSGLDSLVKNDLKYLSEEFNRQLLELVKEKGILMNIWTALKVF